MAYDARAARQNEGGIVYPSLTRDKKPSFTKLAASNKLEGMVELLILVSEHGRVSEFEVIKPLGLGLDEKVIDAVRQWQYTPATQHGKPIGIYMRTSVTFSLIN